VEKPAVSGSATHLQGIPRKQKRPGKKPGLFFQLKI
jgi:hypothetical protein